MNSPEDTNDGPVIRDLRRIDPVTGQVRDPQGRRDGAPGKPARPGRHSVSKPGGTGARPAAPGGAAGAQPPGGGGAGETLAGLLVALGVLYAVVARRRYERHAGMSGRRDKVRVLGVFGAVFWIAPTIRNDDHARRVACIVFGRVQVRAAGRVGFDQLNVRAGSNRVR